MEITTLENKPIIITKPEILIKRVVRKDIKSNVLKVNPVFADIIEESGKEVFDYLERLGVTSKQKILFLSCTRHYLYDSEDLKGVGSIVNFRLTNSIGHVRHYLHTMHRILLEDGYYAGCFLDYKNQRQGMLTGYHSLLGHAFLFLYRFMNRVVPRIPLINKVQHVLNSGEIKCITSNELKELLKKNGFQVIDMVEIEKVTYFVARKIKKNSHKTVSMFDLVNQFRKKSGIIII